MSGPPPVRGSVAPSSPAGAGHRLLARVLDVRPEEMATLGWAWLYILAVLSSYYILRPIRDQLGVAGGVNNLPWLFTGTLLAMLAFNLPFAALVRSLPRSRFIPLTYRFFSANILLFAVALHWASPDARVWIGRAFFIWVSVFNLFVVSVFWAMVVDVFTSEQGKRLFGFIAAGATVGAIIGSGLTSVFAERVAPLYLFAGAALLLEIAVFSARQLSRLSSSLNARPAADQADTPLGGGVLSGIRHTVRSPYLLNVSLYMLLFSLTSTFLYFQQAGIARAAFATRGEQTAFFANIDLLVNVLTLLAQAFATARLLRVIGVAFTFALIPALSIVGFGSLAIAPTIAAIVAFQVVRRAGNYAIARPTRELLFTVVSREDRYKAKSLIDTFVYRAGDQVGAWFYALIGGIGWGAKGVAVSGAVISVAWLANSFWLGRRQEAMAAGEQAVSRTRDEVS